MSEPWDEIRHPLSGRAPWDEQPITPGRGLEGMFANPTQITPVRPGNLDPWNRPIYKHPGPNEDYGTTYSISVGTPDGEVVIPTIINGYPFSSQDAIQHYMNTRENFGTFRTPGEADAFAQWLHEEQARRIQAAGGWRAVKERGGRLAK